MFHECVWEKSRCVLFIFIQWKQQRPITDWNISTYTNIYHPHTSDSWSLGIVPLSDLLPCKGNEMYRLLPSSHRGMPQISWVSKVKSTVFWELSRLIQLEKNSCRRFVNKDVCHKTDPPPPHWTTTSLISWWGIWQLKRCWRRLKPSLKGNEYLLYSHHVMKLMSQNAPCSQWQMCKLKQRGHMTCTSWNASWNVYFFHWTMCHIHVQ